MFIPRARTPLSRRRIIVGGLGVLGTAGLAACGQLSPAAPAAKPAGKLQMKGWNFKPELVAEHINIYKQMYADNVEYELIPTNYDAVMETKFIGGQQVDMCYIFPEKIQRWNKAGWIRDLDGLDGAGEIKKAMYPHEVEKFSTLDGKLGALPYFTAWFIMAYNTNHTDKLGDWKPPSSWAEFLDVCRKLQKDGISKHPFVPMWRPGLSFFNDQMFNDMYSEGEDVFDKDFNPTFKDGGVAFRSVFEMYKTMYDEKIVPPDIFSMDGRQSFATGDHTFWSFVVYGLPEVNDAAKSKIAGKVKLMPYPGKVGKVMSVGGGYAMGKNVSDEKAAADLLKYFGTKAKDGKYVIAKRWALLSGLPSAYPEVMNDPEVIAHYQKTWGDVEAAKAQLAKAKARKVDKTLWYGEWQQNMITLGGDFIIGKVPIGELLGKLSDKALQLKQSYPA